MVKSTGLFFAALLIVGTGACVNEGSSDGGGDAGTSGDGGGSGDRLVQYTPDQASWETFATKPFVSGTNTAHDPDGVGWISAEDWAAAEWDGTVYNPSQMTPEEFAAAICPSVDRVRGIRSIVLSKRLSRPARAS